jgi:hypothetical protein
LHAGMRRGEPIDVKIELPPGSRAASLRGGKLWDCTLRPYKAVAAGNADFSAADSRLLSGDVLVRAGGPLLVSLDQESGGRGQESGIKSQRSGVIWDGGVLLTDRPFHLVLKKDEKQAHIAYAVAEKLNGLFREDAQKIRMQNNRYRVQNDVMQRLNQKFDTGRGEIARPSSNLIALNVPFVYSLNPQRYLAVSRLVPLRETPDQQPRYRQRLAQMLLDPKDTLQAALRLEALGQESVAVLKEGLSSPHPLVRFACAESLTYLGSPAGAEELAQAAAKDESLRQECLIALANLNESACRDVLTDLLDQPDPGLRYGAFQALQLLCQTEAEDADRRLRLGGISWLHRVAPQSSPMIHLSLNRAEIVLFGKDLQLRAPAGLSAGTEFTVTPTPEGNQSVVTRTRLGEEPKQRQASLQLDDILWKMAELGAQYPDAVDFLRKADQRGGLSCPLRVDAMTGLCRTDSR